MSEKDIKAERLADQIREKRHAAMAKGDHREAARLDALERQALRATEGGSEPIVGSMGRTA